MAYRFNYPNAIDDSAVTWYNVKEEGWVNRQVVKVKNFKMLWLNGLLQRPGKENDYIVKQVSGQLTTVKFPNRLIQDEVISVL